MYRRFLLALIAALAAWAGAWAQGISVTSFKPLPDDLTANIAGSMEKDQNGEVAALIKVVTTQTGFTFEGGMAGIVKTKQEAGEIWVYVPHGIQKITIKHPQLGVLRNYYFPCAIDAARTYEMVLASGEVRTVVTQDAGGSYLVISLQPKTAVVYIDDQLQENDGSGEMMKALTYGEHQYRVEANGYMPEAGIVTIGKEKKVLNIKLQSALATLTVNSTTSGTQIVVNEQVKGSGNWSGNLTPGMYIIEGRLDSHRSQKMSVTLGKQEQKAITIPALEPMYGMLDVSYKPIGAEVWLDGKQLGASPDIYKNVFAGTHKLTIKKAGYTDHTETITLAEGEKKVVTGALTANSTTSTDFSGKIPAKGTEAYGYYQKAITGDAEAQTRLGNEFYHSKDFENAVYWYRKAAEQGNATAQNNLGICYEDGEGVTKDIYEAVKWYRKAAAQGNIASKSMLKRLGYNENSSSSNGLQASSSSQPRNKYSDFTGRIPAKGTKAYGYYEKAITGDAPAQNSLAFEYDKEKDYASAVYWYRKAAAQGHSNAKSCLKRLGYSENSGESAASQASGSGQSGNKSTVSGEVYQRADIMPEFPGGQGAMFRWLGENLKYPPIALEEGIQGRVLIHFVVTKTGEIADAKVAKSVNPALDKEALRLVRSMPRFTPAKMQGKPVNCYFTLPVTFRITTN
ncbi:MAG: TonB family protein [Muribaculaceae bacterium]